MTDTTHTPKVAPRATEKAGIRIPDIGCGRCNNRWGGTSTCHCSGCHETFTGLTAFDQHRTGSHTHGTRRCLPPADWRRLMERTTQPQTLHPPLPTVRTHHPHPLRPHRNAHRRRLPMP